MEKTASTLMNLNIKLDFVCNISIIKHTSFYIFYNSYITLFTKQSFVFIKKTKNTDSAGVFNPLKLMSIIYKEQN